MLNESNKRQSHNRKTLVGIVTSDKCNKTITVNVERKSEHPLYKKLVISNKKYQNFLEFFLLFYQQTEKFQLNYP